MRRGLDQCRGCATKVVRRPTICCLALLAAVSPAAAGDHAVTFESLMGEMLDWLRLAEFPDPPYTCRQFSSYDRASTTPDDPDTWFANRDAGNFLRAEQHGERQEHVMMDATGPGAIVRIWSANPKGTIRIYIDEDKHPTVAMPMARMLGGAPPIGEPLSGVRSRGANCYLPIPYANRCKVTCDHPKGLYYQINDRTYGKSVKVESFSNSTFDEHIELIRAVNERLARPETTASTARRWKANGHAALHTGDEAVLYEDSPASRDHTPGARVIVEFEIQTEADIPASALRSCVLDGEFDGRQTIACPLGDFFGSAPGLNPYASRPFSVAGDGTMICRWPMPYESSARLRLINRGNDSVDLAWTVTTHEYDWHGRSLHFHAQWRLEGPLPTRPRRDFNYTSLDGRGVWVGDALHVTNPVLHWWGEGDEKIYVDGETFPSHFGTGTEDYYGYAWCHNETFNAPQHNQTRCDGPRNFGHTSVNRFRFLDAIPFTQSLRVDMELWHWAETDVHYAVTTYFYADACKHNVPTITDAALVVPQVHLKVFRRAGALEAEALEIVARTDGCDPVVQTLGTGEENSWSDMHHLWCRASQAGESMTLRVPVNDPGKQNVIAYVTKSLDYGIVQFYINGHPVGQRIDTFDPRHAARVGEPEAHSLGVHRIDGNAFDLTMEVVGANAQSHDPGHYFGLDCIVLRPVR